MINEQEFNVELNKLVISCCVRTRFQMPMSSKVPSKCHVLLQSCLPIKTSKELFKIYDTPEKILALGESGLKEYIKTIGLYNTKAKNIMELSRILVAVGL